MSNLNEIRNFSDIIDHYTWVLGSLVPDCIKNYRMPIPSYDENIYEPKYFPYLITSTAKHAFNQTVNSLENFYDTTIECAKDIGCFLRDGYCPTLTRNKLKNTHTIPALLEVIHEIISYDKEFVCNTPLTSLISRLEEIDQSVYTHLRCSLEYYFDYKSRNKLSERDSALTLKIELINKDDRSTISIEEVCYSWLFKSFSTTDFNGNRVIYTLCIGNTYK